MRRLLSAAAALMTLVVAPGAHAWTWPVDGPVVRPFSLSVDPYAAGQHRGIDIGAPEGTRVRAPASGTVSFVGTVPNGGRAVTILTPDGLAVTLLQLGSASVDRDAAVDAGAVVGTIGPSADAVTTEPHVHLGIRVHDDPHGYLDPLGLLPPRPQAPPPPVPPAEPAPPAAAVAPPPPVTVAVAEAVAGRGRGGLPGDRSRGGGEPGTVRGGEHARGRRGCPPGSGAARSGPTPDAGRTDPAPRVPEGSRRTSSVAPESARSTGRRAQVSGRAAERPQAPTRLPVAPRVGRATSVGPAALAETRVERSTPGSRRRLRPRGRCRQRRAFGRRGPGSKAGSPGDPVRARDPGCLALQACGAAPSRPTGAVAGGARRPRGGRHLRGLCPRPTPTRRDGGP